MTASLLLAFSACLPSTTDPTVEQAKLAVKNGGVLIDVRTKGEFAGGHIDGAINIPVDQLGARPDLAGPKERPVVVYCASGARSAGAKSILLRSGYKQVHDIGSIRNW